MGFIIITSDRHFSNPFLYIIGYKLYKIGDKHVFCKKSEDELRKFLFENPNGLWAKEVVRDTYINLPQ